MSTPILAAKLYIPPTRPDLVYRLHLIEYLNAGLHCKLTLISAPAGFGKTTLVSEWVMNCDRPVAWLSLDDRDNDPIRFLTYFVSALQTITPPIGEGILAVLQSPQPPPVDSILTTLLNDIAAIPNDIILVLDDYHVIDAKLVDDALTFLLQHLPPQMHLVIATREDPHLPLARLRVRGQLTELRVAELRFTPAEAAEFLNRVMNLNLSAEDIAALETRTEGWIAGLQLAALAMQGPLGMQVQRDAADFIQSFTGSNRFVLDYLVEEVLNQQTEEVQSFLLRTSILERLCGPLCEVVLDDPAASGQETLTYIEQANLFLVPLDNERRWYRYHHLFADLLRQRLQQKANDGLDKYHLRASEWYENHDMEVDAFQHAAAANDLERAERLIESEGTPLYLRGEATQVLNWLQSLPKTTLDARPALWVMYAWVLWITHQSSKVEQRLQNAEAALQNTPSDNRTQDIIGNIAAMRAMLAANDYQVDTIITQSRLALDNLHSDNLHVRIAVTRTLGIAHHFQGDRAAAIQAYSKVIAMCEASENVFMNILTSTGLGMVQELENQLPVAAQTYRRVLELVGEPPQPVACEAYLGLARIHYEWNKLDTAEQYANQGVQLAQAIEGVDTVVSGGVSISQLKAANGNVSDAASSLAELAQVARQNNFAYQIPRIVALQVIILLQQGNLAAAKKLVQQHELPLSQARVLLAQGDASAALTTLAPYRRQMDANNWHDERLKVMVLQSVAHQANGETGKAVELLEKALTLAEPGGFIRLFIDEGPQMAKLLFVVSAHGMMPDHIARLLASFEVVPPESDGPSNQPTVQPLVEPLSERELEILQLLAQGLSNREIGEHLFLAVPTVKGHNRNIYAKLQVRRRTEAVARARELGLM